MLLALPSGVGASVLLASALGATETGGGEGPGRPTARWTQTHP